MSKTASLNIRLDPFVKRQAEDLYASFGISLSDAVNMFLCKSIQCRGLPFALKQENPAVAAMQELSAAAIQNGTADMTLDEINQEIASVRNERMKNTFR